MPLEMILSFVKKDVSATICNDRNIHTYIITNLKPYEYLRKSENNIGALWLPKTVCVCVLAVGHMPILRVLWYRCLTNVVENQQQNVLNDIVEAHSCVDNTLIRDS